MTYPGNQRAGDDPASRPVGGGSGIAPRPADIRTPVLEREQISVAPDFRPPRSQPAWRQDFPIDWPQDQYVERRDFLRFMVLTSAAFAVGQAWIAAQNWYRRRRGQAPILRVAAVDQVPVGGSVDFRYPDEHEPCVLVRVGAEEFVAFNQKCTHLSCAVVPRPDEGTWFCPCHNGKFDLRSGAAIAGPPKRPLTRIVLERRGADIYAVGVEERTI